MIIGWLSKLTACQGAQTYLQGRTAQNPPFQHLAAAAPAAAAATRAVGVHFAAAADVV